MQKNISQEHMVPTVFWAEVTPLDPDNDVTDALVQFNRLMHKNDMSEITTTQNLVINALEKQCKDRIQELTNAHKAKTEIFNAVARMYAGNVLASAENMATKELIRKELSVYFGVIGAKKTLGLPRSPEGFQAAKLFDVLIAVYETLGSRPNSVIDNESVGYHSSDSQSPRNNVISDRRNAVPSRTRTQDASHGRTSEETSTRTPDASEETYTRTQDASDQRRIDGTSRRSLSERRSPPIIRIDSDDENPTQKISVTHDLLPDFEYSDRDIPIAERRNALKIVKKITHPDGPFVGVKDKRQVRTLLLWLKAKAKSQFLTIVEYAALLDASLSIEIQHMVPENTCRTYRELHEDVSKRINGLLLQFGATPEAERSKNRTRFANIRQTMGEELCEYVARFDSLLFDLDSCGTKLEQSEITERFVDSLHPANQQEARLLRFARPDCNYYTLKNEVLAMKRPGLRFRSTTTIERNASSNEPTCKRCGGPHKIDECKWKADIACRNCGKTGHMAKICRQPKTGIDSKNMGSESKTSPKSSPACAIEISSIEQRLNDNRPHLACDIGGYPLQVLLDSGAAVNVISSKMFNKLQRSKNCKVSNANPLQIRSACNKHATSTKEIAVPVTYGEKTVILPFRLYPPLQREVIIGVTGLQALGATLRFQQHNVATNQDHEVEQELPFSEVYELSTDGLLHIPDDNKTDFEEAFSLSNPIIEIFERRLDLSELNNFATTTQKIDYCLRAIMELGPLMFAKDYFIELKELETKDQRDLKHQVYRFIVHWKLKTITNTQDLPKVWNSAKAIEQLKTHDRQEWNEHIHGYVKSQWWTSVETSPTKDTDLSAVVFPVSQNGEKTTTVRPCSDFRRLNRASPPISAVTPSVEEAVMQLRASFQAERQIRQYDLAKAFYKIGIAITHNNKPFHPTLKVGNTMYTSDRLVFGLSCGPSGLNVTQDIINFVLAKVLDSENKTILQQTKRIIVMDDYLLIGSKHNLDLLEQVLDYIWEKTGFDSPKTKRCTWSNHPTRWLGGHWKLTPTGKLILSRPDVVLQWPAKVTKRSLFAEAGKVMTIGSSLNETIARTHCDSIRMLAGRQGSWDEPIQDKQLLDTLRKHLQDVNDYYTRARLEEEEVTTLHDVESLTIECDASNTGFGFVCLCGDSIVYTYAKVFNQTQQIWHINRKELYTIAICLQKIDQLLCMLKKVRNLEIRTDSRVAVLQLNEFAHYNSKSIDRRVLMRLRQNIFDLWNVWRRHAIDVTLKHIAGKDNRADVLTRISKLPLEDIMTIDVPAGLSKQTILEAQQSDAAVQKAITITRFYYADDDNIVRHKNGKVYIPDVLAKQVLRQLHQESGHTQLIDLLYNFQEWCFNPHARSYAKSVIRQCGSCELARTDTNGQTTYGPIRRPMHPFEIIGIDLFGPLVRTRGAENPRHILTIVDRLTGYTQFIVIPDAKSDSVCHALATFLVIIGKTTRIIISDNGKQFTDSKEFQQLLREANITHSLIPIHSPHAGGFYETKHKTAVWVIRTMLQDAPENDWQYIATVASQQINSRQSPDRSASPHELIFGYKHTWPTTAAIRNSTTTLEPVGTEDVSGLQSKRHETTQKLLKLWDVEFDLRQQSTEQRFRSKTPNNRQELQLGDHAMFVNDVIKKKFAAQCSGPFQLTEQTGKQTWKTREIATGREFILHARRLRRIDPDNDLVKKPAPAHNYDDNIEEGHHTPPPQDITTTTDPTAISLEHTPEHPRETRATDANAPISTDNVPRAQFNNTPTMRVFEPDSPPHPPITISPHPSGYNLRSSIKANTNQKTKYHALH